MNRQQIIQKLQREQSLIKFESDEDEGAAEFFGEIQSVIDILKDPFSTEEQIMKVANDLSIPLYSSMLKEAK